MTVTVTVAARAARPPDRAPRAASRRQRPSLRAQPRGHALVGPGETAQLELRDAFPGRGVHDLGDDRRPAAGPLRACAPGSTPRRPQAHARLPAHRAAAQPAAARPHPGRRSAITSRRLRRGHRARRHPPVRARRPGPAGELARLAAPRQLYVTQHHRERNADVVLHARHARRGGRAPDTTLDWACAPPPSLADRLPRPQGPRRPDQLRRLIALGQARPRPRAVRARSPSAWLRAAVVFTYVAKDLAVVPPRVLPPQALVIADHAAARRSASPRPCSTSPRAASTWSCSPSRRSTSTRGDARRVAAHRPRLPALDARAAGAARRAAPSGARRPRVAASGAPRAGAGRARRRRPRLVAAG